MAGLTVCMLTSSLFCICELLMKEKPLLLLTKNDQNCVFKPRASHLKLLLRKGEHHNFVLNKCVEHFHLLRILSFCSKTKEVNFVGLQSQI